MLSTRLLTSSVYSAARRNRVLTAILPKQFKQVIPAQTCLMKNVYECALCQLSMQWNNGFIGGI